MKEVRWLLPFTHGVDVWAIDLIMRLAANRRATLIVASLIVIPDSRRDKGPRLELIQQSKDFLEVVRVRAARYQVAIERHEVWTSDVQERMKKLVPDLHCDATIVMIKGKKGVLLDTTEIKDLLLSNTFASLLLIRLPVSRRSLPMSHLVSQFCGWLQSFRKPRNILVPETAVIEEEEPLQVRQESPPERIQAGGAGGRQSS